MLLQKYTFFGKAPSLLRKSCYLAAAIPAPEQINLATQAAYGRPQFAHEQTQPASVETQAANQKPGIGNE
jgi:hypothetical protein